MKDHTVPLTLISLLADGEFHSGEQLGEKLGMSRAAINKHIQTLRDWGVDVFTVPGKGYSLPEPIQLWIHQLFILNWMVEILPSCRSLIRPTNTFWIVLGNWNQVMPASLNISRPDVAVVGVNGFLRLEQTFTSQCSGVWSRDRRLRLA